MGASKYTCPTCKREFSRRPIEHACVRYDLDLHFEKCQPHVRALFDRLVKTARSRGKVQVSALKTMIALNAPALMGGASAQKKALKVSLILPGVRQHRTFRARYSMSTFKISHQFVLAGDEEFDEAFEELVGEAWELAAGEG